MFSSAYFYILSKFPNFDPANSQNRSLIFDLSVFSLKFFNATDPFFAKIAISDVGSLTTEIAVSYDV